MALAICYMGYHHIIVRHPYLAYLDCEITDQKYFSFLNSVSIDLHFVQISWLVNHSDAIALNKSIFIFRSIYRKIVSHNPCDSIHIRHHSAPASGWHSAKKCKSILFEDEIRESFSIYKLQNHSIWLTFKMV